MSDFIKFFTDMVGQANKAPVLLVVGAVLLAMDLVLRSLKKYPNQFIIIPMILFGVVAGAFLGDPGHINPGQAYPRVVLGMYGFIEAVIVWVLRFFILKTLAKWLPEGSLPPEFLKEITPAEDIAAAKVEDAKKP